MEEKEYMEKSSSNQSLSTIKKNYYALAKEVHGVESRVTRLEEQNERQRRRLENLKNKNHQIQDVKQIKSLREAQLNRNHQNQLKMLEMYKAKNREGRSYHSKVVNELKDTISQLRKTNFKQLRDERDKNEKAIRKTKESFLKFNRHLHDKVVNMQNQSQNKVKQYWDVKGSSIQEKINADMQDYQKKIQKLKKTEADLETREKQAIQSLEMTHSASKSEKIEYQTLTSGIYSIR